MNRKQFLRKAAASIAAVALAPVIVDELMYSPSVGHAYKFNTFFKLSAESLQDMEDATIILRDFMHEHMMRAMEQNIKLMEKDVTIKIGTSEDDFTEDLVTAIFESSIKQ